MKINLSLTLVCTFLIASISSAEKLEIESIDGNGQIIFNEISNAANYTVEWAPAPDGPWDVFGVEEPTGSGSITSSVAMFYRVVALTNQPLVEMVLIPGGTNNVVDPDVGAYSLVVEPFYMGTTEVTKELWDMVATWAGTNGYSLYNGGGTSQGENHPVSYNLGVDCVKWCNALSEMEGRTPCYYLDGTNVFKEGLSVPECNFDADGYRFPTIEEWEYAARGGISTNRFPWGNTISHNQANYKSNELYSHEVGESPYGYHPLYSNGDIPHTSPVKSFSANGYGLYDMAGNMAEWCETVGEYNKRAYRGGAWNTEAAWLRCKGGSFWEHLGNYSNYIGFRVVR